MRELLESKIGLTTEEWELILNSLELFVSVNYHFGKTDEAKRARDLKSHIHFRLMEETEEYREKKEKEYDNEPIPIDEDDLPF